jgi:hypothetical protein
MKVQRWNSWKNKVNMIFREVSALVTVAIVLLAKKRKFRTLTPPSLGNK